MGNEIAVLSLLGRDVTWYALLALCGFLLALVLALTLARKHSLQANHALLYGLTAGLMGLLGGRAVYCAVRMDTIFFDSMGDFLGLSPFLDPSLGSVSVIGVLLGCVLAAWLCGLMTRKTAGIYLDLAVLPGVFLLAFMRLIEPLGGQGYGVVLEEPFWCFAPLARPNAWGDWFLDVSFIEGALALGLGSALWFIRKNCRKPGTFFLYAGALLAATQILPEALRCDDVLYIFIFARVTHIGLALLLFLSLLIPLIKGKRRGLSGRAFGGELALMILGVGLCIGSIFALDKTNLPKLLVYAVLFLTLAGMAFLSCRRIRKEDIL